MIKARTIGVKMTVCALIACVAILASACGPVSEDGQPQVKIIKGLDRRGVLFKTNFRLYQPGETWPSPIHTAIQKIDGVRGVTFAGYSDPYKVGINIGDLFDPDQVIGKVRERLLSLAPKQQ